MSFLVYWVTELGVTGAALVARYLLTARPAFGPVPELDPYALATLAGGPDRLTMVVVQEMVRDGRLRIRGRMLERVASADIGSDPLRQAVISCFEGKPMQHGGGLLIPARHTEPIRARQQPLLRAGLAASRGMRVVNRLLMMLPVAAGIPTVVGLLGHHPAGFSYLNFWPFTLIFALVGIAFARSTVHATPLGRTVLRRMRRAIKAGLPDPVVLGGHAYDPASITAAVRGEKGISEELEFCLFGEKPSYD